MDATKNGLLDHASLDCRSTQVRYGFFVNALMAQKSEVNDKEFCINNLGMNAKCISCIPLLVFVFQILLLHSKAQYMLSAELVALDLSPMEHPAAFQQPVIL